MNVLDIIIILIFILGMYAGFKKGFLKGIISLIGITLIMFISFIFRSELAGILLKTCPFFTFKGVYKGISSLNILIYEGIAFIIIFMFLFGFLAILLNITGILQKLIDKTIVLTIPSKILSIIVGAINALVITFVMLFILLNINTTRKYVYNSFISKIIMERTVLFSKEASRNYLAYEEINDVVKTCHDDKDKNKCNIDVTNTLIKYEVVSKKEVEELIMIGKLKGINRKDLIRYD